MQQTEIGLCERLEALSEQSDSPSTKRLIIALAGGPGSGKSTISAFLQELYNKRNEKKLKVVPLDGFHYYQTQLKDIASTAKECPFKRRGAPFTFDAPAFVKLLRNLRQAPVTEQEEQSLGIWAPSFDHAKKDPVENDIYIPSSQRIIVLEGSYLLLDEEPWRQVRELVDETWFIDVSREEAKTRIIKRHLAAGIENTWEAAEKRVETNDLLNLDLVNKNKGFANVVIGNSNIDLV